jgi:Acyl-CoA thioesterase C-terminal domain/Acyl-CoA thioesterase N-terminal domain
VTQPEHVYEVDGDTAVPTELARGPWSPQAQHGGAPSALLAGELEAFEPGPATFPARFTLELMRPVPLTPLRIERRTIRPGKKVQLVQGSLFADDVEVVRATLLRLREQPVDVAAEAVAGEYVPMPPPGVPQPLVPRLGDALGTGFWNTVDVSGTGGAWDQTGPSGMWLRLRVPIVAGEETSPFQRVAAAGDFGNGVAAAFDRGRYSCINPDLTITLHRLPVGEWVGLDSATYPERNGYGVAESVLHDERGRIGRGIQTVLVEEI